MKKNYLILAFIILNFVSACGQVSSNNNLSSNNANSNTEFSNSLEHISTENESFKIKNYSFTLTSDNNACMLTFKEGKTEQTLEIDLPSPCQTLKWYGTNKITKDGQIISDNKLKRFIVNYDKVSSVKANIFIIGSLSNNSSRCKGEAFQGYQLVLVKDNEIKLGKKHVLQDSSVCEYELTQPFFGNPSLPFGLDEKIP